jgi:hypothetical protein
MPFAPARICREIRNFQPGTSGALIGTVIAASTCTTMSSKTGKLSAGDAGTPYWVAGHWIARFAYGFVLNHVEVAASLLQVFACRGRATLQGEELW